MDVILCWMEECGIPIPNPVGGEATGHTLALAARQGKTMIPESDAVRGPEGTAAWCSAARKFRSKVYVSSVVRLQLRAVSIAQVAQGPGSVRKNRVEVEEPVEGDGKECQVLSEKTG